MMGGLHQEKITFCTTSINEIQNAVRVKLKEDGNDVTVNLSAYILSVTPFSKMGSHLNKTRNEFKDHHILFIDDRMNYLNELFEGKL
jgi:hypothetical protein